MSDKIKNEIRTFVKGETVVYKPYEGCSDVDVSGEGKIIEVLVEGFYKVTFGHRSIHGTRTGTYHWTNLFKV